MRLIRFVCASDFMLSLSQNSAMECPSEDALNKPLSASWQHLTAKEGCFAWSESCHAVNHYGNSLGASKFEARGDGYSPQRIGAWPVYQSQSAVMSTRSMRSSSSRIANVLQSCSVLKSLYRDEATGRAVFSVCSSASN